MSHYARWRDIRAEHVERAGGEGVVAAKKAPLLAEVTTAPWDGLSNEAMHFDDETSPEQNAETVSTAQ